MANPTGATVVNGTAAILQNGNLLQIINSPNAIINWQSFSIGANEITRFIQQSQASAVLNRVVGAGGAIDPSVILGALQSNGRVFLINPSGILFGAGAQVDVAGLIATSLNLSNEDFLSNRLRFSEVAGAGSAINQGNITTGPGGAVYLVGSAVTNNGIITSPQGEVVLAAGNSVELVNPGTPNLRVEIVAPDNQAVNLGQVVAESGRVGIYAGLIHNSGTVSAGSAVAEGGKILLKATKNVTLESTSILDASGNGGGTIEVLSKNGGAVNVAGRLDASAPSGGDGGFIDTSADTVKIADGTVVTTAAPFGKTGTWLIDPNDYLIASYGGDITGAQLSANLGNGTAGPGTSIIITSDQGFNAYGSGAIEVQDTVSWSSDTNRLTLIARGNVNVFQPITNSGNGSISLYAGWDGTSPANAPVVNPFSFARISIGAPISTQGDMALIASQSIGGVNTDPAAAVTASKLLADGGEGGVFLEGANMVNILAGRAAINASSPTCCGSGGFDFNNGKSLTIGSVTSPAGNLTLNGITTGNGEISIGLDSPVNGTLTVNQPVIATTVSNPFGAGLDLIATGNIVINNTVTAQGGNNTFTGGASTDIYADGQQASLIIQSTGGSITVNGGASITATAGNGGNVTTSFGVASANGGQAAVNMSAATGIAMNGTITVTGGAGGSASSSYGGNAYAIGGSATADVSGGAGPITIGGNISATAGNAGSGTGLVGGLAYGGSAEIIIGTNSGAVTTTGNIAAIAGAGGIASSADSAAVGMGGEAHVDIFSGTGLVTVNGAVTATGGNGGSNVSGTGNNGACGAPGDFIGNACAQGGSAEVFLYGGSGGTTVNGSVHATGGTGGTATGTSHNADGGEALVAVTGSGTLTIGAGGITVTGGNGGGGGSPRHGGEADILLANVDPNCDCSDPPILRGGDVQIGGNLVATGGNGTGSGSGAEGGDALVVMLVNSITQTGGLTKAQGGTGPDSGGIAIVGENATGDITLSGGSIQSTVGGTSPSLLGLFAGNNVTVNGDGGNISSSGGPGSSGWFASLDSDIPGVIPGGMPDDASGLGIIAGNKIISAGGTGGVLGATNTGAIGPSEPGIFLSAVNGVGTIANPIRVNDVNSAINLNIQNTGTSGDIAISIVTGDATINDDIFGTFNNNPTGTFFIKLENGNFVLNAPFRPSTMSDGADATDLNGQSLVVNASGNVVLNAGASIVTTTGSTSLTGANVTQDSGGNLTGLLGATATAGNVTLTQAGPYSLGLLSATGAGSAGNISVTTTDSAIGDITLSSDVIATGNITVQAARDLTQLAGTITNASGFTTAGTKDITLSGQNVTLTGVASQRDLFTSASGALTVSDTTAFGAQNFHFDDNYFEYTLPFTFTFFGTPYSTAYINSNGSITFGSGTTAYSDCVSCMGSYRMIAPAWNDWATYGTNASGVPHDIHIFNTTAGLAVRWDVARYANDAAKAQFETVLAPSGNIMFNYGPATTTFAGDVTIGLSNFGSPTVVSLLMNQGTQSFDGSLNFLNSTTFLPSGGSYSEAVSSGSNFTGSVSGGASAGVISALRNAMLGAGGAITFAGNITAGGIVSLTSSGSSILEGGSGGLISGAQGILSAATGIGSIANPLETQVGSIALSSGGGEIGVINNGDLLLNSLSSGGTTAAVYASTQFGAPSGALTIGGDVAVSGNLALLADTGMTVNRNVSATGALVLDAGSGTLSVVPGAGNTTVSSGSLMALSGTSIALGSDSQTSNLDIVAGNSMVIGAGNLAVTGGNGGHTFVGTSGGNMAIVTTGDVAVTGGTAGGFAHVLGSPDLIMSVGGTVQLNATDATAPARIESAAPTTISLDFTTVPSGGYFVNGQEGVTSDASLGTGFYADGVPAVSGQNLLITYNGVPLSDATSPPPAVVQAFNQIIVSTNQQSTNTEEDKLPEAETNGGTYATEPGGDKKKLPVCN